MKLIDPNPSASQPSQTASPTHSAPETTTATVAVVLALLLLLAIVVYISFGDGVDYLHGFGRACLVAHDGWHFQMQCGSVNPPNS